MGIIKKLASQTAIYGLSSIFGRFLNYLLVPLYTYYFSAAQYGIVSEFYAYAGFFSVLLLFGFETGYFRFRDKAEIQRDVAYSTALIFVLVINLLFLGLIVFVNNELSSSLNYATHPEYVLCFSAILTLDALSAIPFARLRAQNKAFVFAGIKILEILISVLLSLFFIVYCPKALALNAESWVKPFYNPNLGISYIFLANLMASAFKFIVLIPQFLGLRWGFNRALFIKMLRYSLPMVVIGFAGIINEMLDRALLKFLLPYDPETNMQMLGIYSACYKLSILMSLFIQAFRFAAEPFFFAYADKDDAKAVYAKILNYFVIFCVFIFLLVSLYIDFFKYFLGAEFRVGLKVVPVLLMANLFLGIYVNLSIWYKLTDRTLLGACVSLTGAVITVLLNIWWIPLFGYEGSAWATLICYVFMALISYLLGRRYYPINYNLIRILAYISLGIGLFLSKDVIPVHFAWQTPWLISTALLAMYLLIVLFVESIPQKKLNT